MNSKSHKVFKGFMSFSSLFAVWLQIYSSGCAVTIVQGHLWWSDVYV